MKPAKISLDWLDAHVMAPKFSKICSGAGEQPPLLAVENLLRSAESSFSNVKFSKIVLGGTAAPYAHRVWGAVIF
jgi:hypothetical protein